MISEGFFSCFFEDFNNFLFQSIFLGEENFEDLQICGALYFFLFFCFLIGFLPFGKFFILTELHWLVLVLYLSGVLNFFRGYQPKIIVSEEGVTLVSLTTDILLFFLSWVQPITLWARLIVNLLLGEVALFLVAVSPYSGRVFFLGFFELVVIFVQRAVFFFLLFFYKKN